MKGLINWTYKKKTMRPDNNKHTKSRDEKFMIIENRMFMETNNC